MVEVAGAEVAEVEVAGVGVAGTAGAGTDEVFEAWLTCLGDSSLMGQDFINKKDSSSIVSSLASAPGISAMLTLKYFKKALMTASLSPRLESGVDPYAIWIAATKSSELEWWLRQDSNFPWQVRPVHQPDTCRQEYTLLAWMVSGLATSSVLVVFTATKSPAGLPWGFSLETGCSIWLVLGIRHAQ